MVSEILHRLALPALAVTIFLTVWVLALERSTEISESQRTMPPLLIDHPVAESGK